MKVDRGTEGWTERGLEGEGNRTRGGDGRKGKTHVACFLIHTHSLSEMYVYMYIHTYMYIYTSLYTYAGLFGRGWGSVRGGGRRQTVDSDYEQSTGAHT